MMTTSVVFKDVWLKDKDKDCKLVLEDPRGQGLSSRTTTTVTTLLMPVPDATLTHTQRHGQTDEDGRKRTEK